MTAAAKAFVDFKVLILLFINYSPTSKKNSNYKDTLSALRILLSDNSARQNFQTYKTHFFSRTVGTFFFHKPSAERPKYAKLVSPFVASRRAAHLSVRALASPAHQVFVECGKED